MENLGLLAKLIRRNQAQAAGSESD